MRIPCTLNSSPLSHTDMVFVRRLHWEVKIDPVLSESREARAVLSFDTSQNFFAYVTWVFRIYLRHRLLLRNKQFSNNGRGWLAVGRTINLKYVLIFLIVLNRPVYITELFTIKVHPSFIWTANICLQGSFMNIYNIQAQLVDETSSSPSLESTWLCSWSSLRWVSFSLSA